MAQREVTSSEPPETVYFVDDDGEASASLIRALKGLGLRAECHAFTTAKAATDAIRRGSALDVAVIDLSLEPMKGVESGFELLREIVRHSPDTRIVVLTGHGSDEYGIKALQLGAANFLEKPANPSHLAALITDGIAQCRLRRRVRDLEQHAPSGGTLALVGASAAMSTLRTELDFLASNTLSVFLRGETGVGKSYFAQALHQRSKERGVLTGAFVSYAPRAGGMDLISSDLFGHIKGAFTGAAENKAGLLQHANGGTLFLDEIDELPSEVQVTLLTVLQNRSYRPVGSTKEEAFTGRIIAASNADHEESQRSGKLRTDLFHRLAQEIVIIPPLRERREDIGALAEAFLIAIKRREPSAIGGFDTEAVAALQQYDWPGNVRELEKAVERAVARAAFERQVIVRAQDLPPSVSQKAAQTTIGQSVTFADQVENFKVKLIEDALAKHGGNQLKAAESLALDRSSLRRIYARRQ